MFIEIETLQFRSIVLNAQFENRGIVEKFLKFVIKKITIAFIIIKTISDDIVDLN